MRYYSVVYTQNALADIAESVFWYESQQIGLGTRFMDAVELTSEHIRKYPEGYQKKYKSTREKPVRIFPYVLIYTIEERVI